MYYWTSIHNDLCPMNVFPKEYLYSQIFVAASIYFLVQVQFFQCNPDVFKLDCTFFVFQWIMILIFHLICIHITFQSNLTQPCRYVNLTFFPYLVIKLIHLLDLVSDGWSIWRKAKSIRRKGYRQTQYSVLFVDKGQ